MISVVVPIYNAERFLAEAIQSVQRQTVTDWELILVDDGSKDNSLAIAEELCRQDNRISVFSRQNSGVSTTRNFGLAQSRPDYPYILWFDNDDLLVPHALQSLKALLESHPEASAACSFLHDMDAEGRIIPDPDRLDPLISRRGVEGRRLVRRGPDAPLVFGDLCFRNHIITPGQVLIRKSALQSVGAFDVSRAYTEDHDLWWRLTMQDWPNRRDAGAGSAVPASWLQCIREPGGAAARRRRFPLEPADIS